jgi:hypothetical protein
MVAHFNLTLWSKPNQTKQKRMKRSLFLLVVLAVAMTQWMTLENALCIHVDERTHSVWLHNRYPLTIQVKAMRLFFPKPNDWMFMDAEHAFPRALEHYRIQKYPGVQSTRAFYGDSSFDKIPSGFTPGLRLLYNPSPSNDEWTLVKQFVQDKIKLWIEADGWSTGLVPMNQFCFALPKSLDRYPIDDRQNIPMIWDD